LRLKPENLIAIVKSFTGPFAFLIAIFVGALVQSDPFVLLAASVITYIFASVMGSVFGKLIERINYEIKDVYRDFAEEEDKTNRNIGSIIDYRQSAETPYKK
jgi:hypothetical protein